jgi:hypothetical protein
MSAPTAEDLTNNALLASLSKADQDLLIPHMLVCDLNADEALQKAGHQVSDTWFPCGPAMAAFRLRLRDGSAVEVALVGREGAIGGIVSNGQVPAFATAKVLFGGRFLRVKTAALEQAKLDSLTLRHWFSRYSDCLLAQVFQTSACNAAHTIAQRTAKWLLAAMSRTRGPEFAMTHVQLAEMLGVGRAFVTRVVAKLREAGTIETRRGIFIVKNEPMLRDIACDCTMTIEDHFDVVLRGIYQQQ